MKKFLTLAAFAALSTSALAGIDPCGEWVYKEVKICKTKTIKVGEKSVTQCVYTHSYDGEVDHYTDLHTIEHEGNVECREYTKHNGRPAWLYDRNLKTVYITRTVPDPDNCDVKWQRVWVPNEDNAEYCQNY